MNQNISLAKLHVNHAQELYELTDANRDYLREWLPWLDLTKSYSATKAFIESTIDGPPIFAVMHQGAICGVAGFHEINYQHKTGSIGYWLAKSYSGRGIMTMAVKDLLKMGFGEFGLNKIEIRCASGNLKSRAIPQRLGFTHEATLRQCEWLYSKYVDHAAYSILASEYST